MTNTDQSSKSVWCLVTYYEDLGHLEHKLEWKSGVNVYDRKILEPRVLDVAHAETKGNVEDYATSVPGTLVSTRNYRSKVQKKDVDFQYERYDVHVTISWPGGVPPPPVNPLTRNNGD